MSKDLIIFGTSSFAEIAALYFARDTEYTPVALCVDEEFLTVRHVYGLPVVGLTEVQDKYDLAETSFYVATTYTQLNRLRVAKCAQLRSMGMAPASYVSPRAYVDETARLGDHIFVFEDNTIQPFVTIEDDVILWSGNHIGHHSVIETGVFISSQVVVSGHCRIGAHSFLGVNATIGNNVEVGKDNWLLPGCTVLQSTEDDSMWKPARTTKASASPRKANGLD